VGKDERAKWGTDQKTTTGRRQKDLNVSRSMLCGRESDVKRHRRVGKLYCHRLTGGALKLQKSFGFHIIFWC